MDKKKLILFYFSIPFTISIISSLTTGAYLLFGPASKSLASALLTIFLRFAAYALLLSITQGILFIPVLTFFKTQNNVEKLRRRLELLPLLSLICTFCVKVLGSMIFFTHFRETLIISDIALVFKVSFALLNFFIALAFPSFLIYILVKEAVESIMRFLFHNYSISFDPKKKSMRGSIIFFLFIVSILPVLSLASMVIASDHLLGTLLEHEVGEHSNHMLYLILILVTILGAIVLSTFTMLRHFRHGVKTLLKIFTKVAAGDFSQDIPVASMDEFGQLSLQFNHMIYGLRERDLLKAQFGSHVSPEVRDYVINNTSVLEGEERTVTVLFTDIAGYTSMSEKLSPKDTVSLLNSYYTMLVEIVQNHKGIVNKFIGDSLMAVFNAPNVDPSHAQNALRCAQEIAMITENYEFPGKIKLKTRVGINTGSVIAGNLGSKERYEYTFIGDAVNLAQRLEQISKKFDKTVIFSEQTKKLLSDDGIFTYLGKVKVKGKSEWTRVYTIA